MVMTIQPYRKAAAGGVGATLLDSDSLGADKNVGTTWTDVGMLVSVSPSAGDKFRIVASFDLEKKTTTGLVYMRIMQNIDSAGWTELLMMYQGIASSGTETSVEMEWVDDDPGGTTVEYRLEGQVSSGTADFESGATLEVYDVTDALVAFVSTATQTTSIGTTYKDITNVTHTFTPTNGTTYRVCGGVPFREMGSASFPDSRVVQDGSEITGTEDTHFTGYTNGHACLRSLATGVDLGGSSTTIKVQARSGAASASTTSGGGPEPYLIIETEA